MAVDVKVTSVLQKVTGAKVVQGQGGTVGTIQTTEVLKLILGVGETLHGRLLLYDALAMEFRQVRIRKDPKCVLCGEPENPADKVTGLIDYDAFCGGAFGHGNEEEQKAADAAAALRA